MIINSSHALGFFNIIWRPHLQYFSIWQFRRYLKLESKREDRVKLESKALKLESKKEKTPEPTPETIHAEQIEYSVKWIKFVFMISSFEHQKLSYKK